MSSARTSRHRRSRRPGAPRAAVTAVAIAGAAALPLLAAAPALAATTALTGHPASAPAAKPRVPYQRGTDTRTTPHQARASAAVAPRATTSGVLTNGGFETGDFSGWKTDTVFDGTSASAPHVYVSEDTLSMSGYVLPAAPEGRFQAFLDDGAGNGSEVVSQDITVPAGGGSLRLTYSYRSFAPIADPPTLDYTGAAVNQQLRIDLLRTSAAVRSVDGADLLASVFRTTTGDATMVGLTTVTTDLTPFAGQTVRLRIADASNVDSLIATVDDVTFVAAAPTPVVPEAPYAALLPVAALAATAGVVVVRRRRLV